MDLKELNNGVNPHQHWYYQSKIIPLYHYFESVSKTITHPINIIDFGSGSGFFAIELLKKYPNKIKKVYLIDIEYTDEEIQKTKGTSIEKYKFLPQGLENNIVLMMDVLEHIEKDIEVLKEIKSQVGKNTRYFATVPAFMSLWSGHDVYLGHYRRYTSSTFNHIFTTANFKIDKQYYMFALIFPIAFIVRKIKNIFTDTKNPTSSDMSAPPYIINTFLKLYHKIEMYFCKKNKWAGLTCVAEGIIKE